MRSRSRQATVPDKLGEKDTLAWRGLIPACIVHQKGPDFARNQDLFCAAAINVFENFVFVEVSAGVNMGGRAKWEICAWLPMRAGPPGIGTMPACSNEYLECVCSDHKALCGGPALQALCFFIKGIDTYIGGS